MVGRRGTKEKAEYSETNCGLLAFLAVVDQRSLWMPSSSSENKKAPE